MTRILVTGSSGLIGSEVVSFFANAGFDVFGIDNNMRRQFFGEQGCTRWNQARLQSIFGNFQHNELDIRNREAVLELIEDLRPDAIVHTAAQPSHDRAAAIPFDDFEVNAVGTMNLLEATRRFCKDSPFIHMSTNKVYGDAPNALPMIELPTRWDYKEEKWRSGISESFTIDQSKHSIFGASKVAADIMVQEYGRYFDMPTCCLRGGCLTGPSHSGVELHGFLSYLIKRNVDGKKYTVFGYQGKQVRDNIHAWDVANFINAFISAPRCAEVYNLGGGSGNSVSILEAFSMAEQVSGQRMIYDYEDEARSGDHIVYYSDLTKMKTHYPQWDITRDLEQIFTEIHEAWVRRPQYQTS